MAIVDGQAISISGRRRAMGSNKLTTSRGHEAVGTAIINNKRPYVEMNIDDIS